MRRSPSATMLALATMCVLAITGCAAASPGATAPAGASGSTTSVPRPSSTAQLVIVSPSASETVTGATIHVVVALTGATIVSATTTDVRPDRGHIHLYVDNSLVSMNYATAQDLPAIPGTHVLRAEFVASDHVPFNPRVVTPDVVFTVKP